MHTKILKSRTYSVPTYQYHGQSEREKKKNYFYNKKES